MAAAAEVEAMASSRTLRRALALAVLIAAAVRALGHATVTESTITSPAKPTYLLFEPAPTLAAETLTVVATTDGAAKDQVDVICTFGDDYARIAEDLELVAGGTLDAEVSLAGFPVHLCDLRVVPAGYAARTSRRSPPRRRREHVLPRPLQRPRSRRQADGHPRLRRRDRSPAGRGRHRLGRGRWRLRRRRREGGSARAVRLPDLARRRRHRRSRRRRAGRVHDRGHPCASSTAPSSR